MSQRAKPAVVIHTDGACSGNPGPGGWGAVLVSGSHRKEIYGGEPLTTNNRMELMAAISALEALKRHHRASIFTPIQSTCGTASALDRRLEAARLEDGRQEAGKKRRAVAAPRCGPARHEVAWHWLKGHAGHVENEQADALARQGMQPFLRKGPTAPEEGAG